MFGRALTRGLLAVAIVASAVAAQAAVTIETVPVGNTGNTADTRYDSTGFGAVNYAYNIGKYEVTAGQYTAFLNAVGGVDTYALYNTEHVADRLRLRDHAERRRNRRQSLHLHGGVRLRQPSGELRELLGRLPVRQLAAQRPADRRAGCGHNGDGGVHPDQLQWDQQQHDSSQHRIGSGR